MSMARRTLSREAEDRVIAAVKRAASAVNDGDTSPDAAIEKEARDLKWGPEMIKFAAVAYNTGRQNAQLETASGALEKFADFPLANPEKIIGGIWPSEINNKQAADNSVSSEYSRPMDFTVRRAASQRLDSLRRTVKAAADKASASACKACGKSPCQCQTSNYRDASYHHKQLKTAAEAARHQAAAAYDRLASAVNGLTAYFSKSARDRIPFADAELAIATYHGDTGQKLMDMVYDRCRLKEARCGTAGVKFAGSPYDVSMEPYKTAERVVELASLVHTKRAKAAEAYEAVEGFVRRDLIPLVRPANVKTAWDALNGTVETVTYSDAGIGMYLPSPVMKAAVARPFAQAPSTSKQAQVSWNLLDGDGADPVRVKSAEGPLGMMVPPAIGSASKQLMERAMGGGDDPVQSAWMSLEDPAHDSQLRAIRTQALMADLMNDPVIGGYDPEEVSKTYNELSMLNPRSAQQPIVMRAALRRHLEGNIQPHEVRDSLETENNLKNTVSDTPQTTELSHAPKSLLG